MAFRTLTIDSAAEVHVRSGQLTVQREIDDKPLHIDLDDIACIVLANLDITLSTGALNMISSHGITVLGVGRNRASSCKRVVHELHVRLLCTDWLGFCPRACRIIKPRMQCDMRGTCTC